MKWNEKKKYYVTCGSYTVCWTGAKPRVYTAWFGNKPLIYTNDGNKAKRECDKHSRNNH